MTIFSLLVAGIVFLLLTGIIIAIDNRRRKYKKKMLALHWRIIGIVLTILTLVSFSQFVGRVLNFKGEECGDRKVLLRSTTKLAEVKIPSDDATLDMDISEKYDEVLTGIGEASNEIELEFVDALLNKKRLPLSEIHEVKYSEDLSLKQIQFVEYLVMEKDGYFTKPGIHYYIIFSKDYQEQKIKEKEAAKKKAEKEKKKKQNKDKKKNKKDSKKNTSKKK